VPLGHLHLPVAPFIIIEKLSHRIGAISLLHHLALEHTIW